MPTTKKKSETNAIKKPLLGLFILIFKIYISFSWVLGIYNIFYAIKTNTFPKQQKFQFIVLNVLGPFTLGIYPIFQFISLQFLVNYRNGLFKCDFFSNFKSCRSKETGRDKEVEVQINNEWEPARLHQKWAFNHFINEKKKNETNGHFQIYYHYNAPLSGQHSKTIVRGDESAPKYVHFKNNEKQEGIPVEYIKDIEKDKGSVHFLIKEMDQKNKDKYLFIKNTDPLESYEIRFKSANSN